MTRPTLDLTLSRLLPVPRAAIWTAWTTPDLLPQWWCPRPWTTELRAFDLRPGGAFHTLMRGPDGAQSDNPGAFLDIVAMERIVFTSALTEGWRPAESWLAMTAIITMADEGGGTRYVARVLHRTPEDRQRHEELGFEQGWNIGIDQLAEVAARHA